MKRSVPSFHPQGGFTPTEENGGFQGNGLPTEPICFYLQSQPETLISSWDGDFVETLKRLFSSENNRFLPRMGGFCGKGLFFEKQMAVFSALSEKEDSATVCFVI